MKPAIIYMLEVLVCSGVLLAAYAILLERRVKFRWCRLYLLLTTFAAALIPLLRIPVWPGRIVAALPAISPDLPVWTGEVLPDEGGGFTVTPESLCLGLYLLGAALIAGVMVWQVIRIRRLRRGAEISRTGDYTLVRTRQEIASFSFLRTIYVWDKTPAGELAAILARKEAAARTGLPPEQIGVFGIVPCSSQVTAAHHPETLAKPVLDGAFAIRDIYLRLLGPMKELQELESLSSAGIMGVGWAYCGGESAARLGESYLAVDGIGNCIRMLEEIEDGRLPEADFIELSACVQGCVGGCLTVENPYGARMRIKNLMKGLPVSRNRFNLKGEDRDLVCFDKELQYVPAFLLDEDRSLAMEKLMKIDELYRALPGLDCGSCGAPSCHALAEDVVLGRASEEDCIFKVRERMQYMAGTGDADEYLPAPFRKRKLPQSIPPKKPHTEEGGTLS